MKRNTLALLLCAVLLLTACAAPPAETTAPPTTLPVETTVPETTAPAELICYPLNASATYVSLAQELPTHIYTTTGSENGLAGTVYLFEGVVKYHDSFTADGIEFEQAVVETNGGDVVITNFYKAVYNATVLELGADLTKAYYTTSVDNYVFPADGERAVFLTIYGGFSGSLDMPSFYLGANAGLFEMIDLPDPAATAKQEPTDAELGTKDNPYLEGSYKVGSDIPAGEYLFVITDTSGGYVCVSADSNKDDIIENEIVELCWFATVEDGQYLEVRDCAFIKADSATLNINADGSFSSGMYRVGIDIPAGEYKLTTDDTGYWCIYKDSVVPFDIVNNDMFDASSYVTVKDGQYLKISDCTAVPVK